ncbi:MAG: S-adenosyl-l-methionine hydroxide adenosyltransferase family protein [ANME-2 cluster archaeon]|nr:S-adenosyl-l-methionine hydroxide adenosyltransferase family protein [ANME-2 cluster archaeon]
MAVISMLSDFGHLYPAQMKAVILRINPSAVLVDISHHIPAQGIKAGAFALMVSAPYFPEGTVHLAVVDPGVGTSRRPIVVESGAHLFVGPDNGLLIPAAFKLSQDFKVWEITNPELFLILSSTFHGRDIFAPVAARLSLGMAASDVGNEIADFVELDLGTLQVIDGKVRGQVVYVDSFGNVITNIPGEFVIKRFKFGDMLDICGTTMPFVHTYISVKEGAPLALVGSHGYLEISVNLGNAVELLELDIGDIFDLIPFNSGPFVK